MVGMRAVIALLAVTACGRLAFDPQRHEDGDARGQGLDGTTDGTSEVACVGIAATCGPTGSSSCCATRPIPGGPYYRSYDVGADGMYPTMSAPAAVSDFRLDSYEITVGRFRAFVAAGQGTQATPPAAGAGAHLNLPTSGWSASWSSSLAANTAALTAAVKCDAMYQTWTDQPSITESHPMNCITWYEAMAFCVWDGGYLPTEAEWNYAATGGNEQRAYPWSMPATSTAIDDTRAAYGCVGDGTAGCATTDLLRVGSKPLGDGRWGQSDLAGSVWEWALDWYSMTYSTPCTDCALLATQTFRVHRGGAFRNTEASSRAAMRGWDPASYRASDVGARCARP